jgi:branched-chain amino acid transport system ATP-binding protein
LTSPPKVWPPKSWHWWAEFLRELRHRGVSVLLIEQNFTIAMQISDRALVMGHGSMVFDGTPSTPCDRMPAVRQGMVGGIR